MYKDNIFEELFSNKRNLIKLLIDLLTVGIGIFLAIYLRFKNSEDWNEQYSYILIYGILFLVIYLIRKNGIKSWSFTSYFDVLNLIITNIITFILTLGYYAISRDNYSRIVIILGAILVTILQLLWRFLFGLRRNSKNILKKPKNRMKTILYGGGEAGVMLLREAQQNIDYPYEILYIIDDDKRKIGTYINGIKVIGDFKVLENLVKEQGIETVIIAIPRIDKSKIKDIVDTIKENNDIKIKILPSIENILQDENMTNQIRDISIEDLLGREQIQINGNNIKEIIENKVVCVTGGAGSIGSELSRQIAKYDPKQLILIDVNENDLYFLELELKRVHKKLNLVTEICNIREKDKVDLLFNRYRPNIVFHAAAHKHVPLMEHNPEEAVKNNIFVMDEISDIAIKYKVDRFVLISTDKAVNPTSFMGASKRACEMIIEGKNKLSDTKFMAVRFGNVLGSNGSVIPIFKNLIAEGKNLTLTHPDIVRYFMTIPEAAQLVIEAGALGKGGELFILDMGEPVKIIDLAKTMIKLSGANVGIDIVGLRPGEKLYEELLYDVTKAIKTENNKIFITQIDEPTGDIEEGLKLFKEAVKNPNIDELKRIMKKLIPTYKLNERSR